MVGKTCGTEKTFASGVLGGLCLALAAVGGASAPAVAQTTVATGVGTPFELAFWQSIDSSNDASLYTAYLTHFPNGTFSEIAHAKIISLQPHLATPPLTVPVAPQAQPIAPAPEAATVRVIQPVVPVVQPIAAVAPVIGPIASASTAASPAEMTPAVATTAPAPAAGTLGQLLAALATSQSNEGAAQANASPAAQQPAVMQSATLVSGPVAAAPAPIALALPVPHPTAVSFAMPAQPALSPVPAVAFPPSFCSAEQRNAFHDQVYAPSVNTARRNNEAAAGYLHQLQALYDQYQLSRDPDTMNAIVAAARTYGQVAQTTFSMQAALLRQFPALMAVPVVACAQPMQPTNAVLVK